MTITAVNAYIDAKEAGNTAIATDWLPKIPAWQVKACFSEFAPHCPDRIDIPLIRRPVNGLNVEIMQPHPRCRQLTPKNWGDADPRAVRWLGSGGDPLVLGLCSRSNCPRAKELETNK